MIKAWVWLLVAIFAVAPYQAQTVPDEFSPEFIESLPLLHAKRQLFVTLTGRLVSRDHEFTDCQVFYATRNSTGKIKTGEPIDAICDEGQIQASQVFLSQEINRVTVGEQSEMVVYPPSFFFVIRVPGCVDVAVEHRIPWKNKDPEVKLGKIKVECE